MFTRTNQKLGKQKARRWESGGPFVIQSR